MTVTTVAKPRGVASLPEFAAAAWQGNVINTVPLTRATHARFVTYTPTQTDGKSYLMVWFATMGTSALVKTDAAQELAVVSHLHARPIKFAWSPAFAMETVAQSSIDQRPIVAMPKRTHATGLTSIVQASQRALKTV